MAKLYGLTERTKEDLERIIRKVDSINGPGVRNEPRSISINVPQFPTGKPTPVEEPPSFIIVKVTGFSSPVALGGGKYWCTKQQRKAGTTFAANSTNINFTTFYENATGASTALIIHPLEHGTATHAVATNSFHWAVDLGETTADGYEVYSLLVGISLAC